VNHGENMVLERVQKILSNIGYCSRRNAESLISEKKVKVNGLLIKLGDKADIEKDKIEVEGISLGKKPKKVYIMLNKPKHYVTTTKDPFCKNTVMRLIHEKERIYPVGRLDSLSTGMLLLTNDGDFANKIMHPRYEIKKKYHVILDKPLDTYEKKLIEKGVELDEFDTSPCKIENLSKNEFDIILNEGKNREIKKIFNYFNYHVTDLHRVSVGNLKLDIPVGQYRHLRKEEISLLLKPKKTGNIYK
jgi:23S rRNA pseudouridine2605 synthase